MRLIAFVFVLVLTSLSSAQGWVEVTPAVPGPAAATGQSTACYDPIRGVTWLFHSPSGGSNSSAIASWDGSAWTAYSQNGPTGFPVASAWDPIRQSVVVVFSGSTCGSWNGTAWTLLQPISVGGYVGMAFDAVRGEILLVMGAYNAALFTYTLGGQGWAPESPTVSAWTGSVGASLYYDGSRGRVQAITNHGDESQPTGCWEWSGTNWVQMFTSVGYGLVGQVAPSSSGHNLSVRYPSSGWGQPFVFDIDGSAFSQLFLTAYPATRRHHHLVYDSGRDCFVLHGGLATSYAADTWELTLGPNASYTVFGAGCSGSRGTPSLTPQSGPPTVGVPFALQIGNLPWVGSAFLFFGYSNLSYGGTSLPFNLASYGAPLCSVFVSGDVLFPIPNVLGVSTWSFFVPNYPGLTFYNQAFVFDPAANSLGLTMSNAGHGIIGM